MGRDRLPDSVKAQRGTLLPGRTAEAKQAAAVKKVLAFPTLTEIPPCSLPLPPDGQGMKTYNKWCQILINAGLLTAVSLEYVTTLAMTDETIAHFVAKGKPPPGRTMNDRRSIISKLDLMNADQQIIAGQTKTGKFASNGFPSRLRAPGDHHAQRSG